MSFCVSFSDAATQLVHSRSKIFQFNSSNAILQFLLDVSIHKTWLYFLESFNRLMTSLFCVCCSGHATSDGNIYRLKEGSGRVPEAHLWAIHRHCLPAPARHSQRLPAKRASLGYPLPVSWQARVDANRCLKLRRHNLRFRSLTCMSESMVCWFNAELNSNTRSLCIKLRGCTPMRVNQTQPSNQSLL